MRKYIITCIIAYFMIIFSYNYNKEASIKSVLADESAYIVLDSRYIELHSITDNQYQIFNACFDDIANVSGYLTLVEATDNYVIVDVKVSGDLVYSSSIIRIW